MVVRNPLKHADVVAYSRDGVAVLVVEVKAHEAPDGEREARLRQLASCMLASVPPVDFGLLVEPRRMALVRLSAGALEVVAELNTIEMLSVYDPDAGSRRFSHDYLELLVESWLRDVAYHWKSPDPPGVTQFRTAGIADRLAGGTTQLG